MGIDHPHVDNLPLAGARKSTNTKGGTMTELLVKEIKDRFDIHDLMPSDARMVGRHVLPYSKQTQTDD